MGSERIKGAYLHGGNQRPFQKGITGRFAIGRN